jgi:hypothetical protein
MCSYSFAGESTAPHLGLTNLSRPFVDQATGVVINFAKVFSVSGTSR